MLMPADDVERGLPEAEEAVQTGGRYGPLAFTGDDIELGEELGRGTQAQVFRCKRVRTGEQLAVKVIDLWRLRMLADDPWDSMQKLENEVRLLREVEHECCLGLYDIFRTKKHIFLVMECMEGGELFEQIVKKKRFNEVEARHVFRQVVEGLTFLHSKRIVHRDLKPENVLIAGSREAPPPGGGTLFDVKIADFGLSKLKRDGAELQSLVGTPQYWAPEVIRQAAYDERVDLWSLGVLLYVMLRGKYPFNGDDPNAQIRSGEYDLSSGNWPRVSEGAKDVVRRLLKVDPSERLSLQGCLQHPWLAGRSSPAPQQPQQPPPRRDPGLSLVLARPDRAVHRVGSGSGRAFDLRELMQQQLALASSLEKACLACRHGHADLSASIRQTLCKVHVLWQHALKVVGQYAQTARDVKERVLPDLDLAVQEAEPDLAVELLDVVHGWVQKMHADGEETYRMCRELSHELNRLLGRAQEERAMEGPWQEQPRPGQAALCDAAAGAARAPPLPGPPSHPGAGAEKGDGQHTTHELIQGLLTFVNKLAMTDGECGGEPELCKRDLIDLLFMAPGLDPGSGPCPGGQATVVEVQQDAMSDVSASPRPLTPEVRVQTPGSTAAEQTALCPLPAAATGTGALVNTSPGNVPPAALLARAHPLLRAVHELRRVTEILQECSTFWTDLGSTVQELSRFREQTRALLKYAAGNARLKERFDQRLAEYSDFWGSLMDLCEQYCRAIQPALQKTFHFINKVESAADAVDTARRLVLSA